MAAVSPKLLTQGRREREEETVWRGEQYKRAIGLYFRKFGCYPTKVDDLAKQTNGCASFAVLAHNPIIRKTVAGDLFMSDQIDS